MGDIVIGSEADVHFSCGGVGVGGSCEDKGGEPEKKVEKG